MRKGRAQQLQTLGIELGMHEREACNITARMRKALSETSLYRIHQDRADNRNVAAYACGGV